MNEIILSTGYEIKTEGEWEDQFIRELFAEMVFGNVKSGASEDFDQAFQLLVLECQRLSIAYDFHFQPLIMKVMAFANAALSEADKKAPQKLLH